MSAELLTDGGQRRAATDWKRAAGRMRAELERADLNERPRRLAMWSIKVTLLAGRVSVVIPNRARVGHVLGILPQHFGAIAEELARAGILTLKEVSEGWELIVYPDSSSWCCGYTWARETMEGLLSEIASAPGQVQGELLEPEPCLAKAMAEVGVDAIQNGKVKMQNGEGSLFGNRQVPEKGTGDGPLRSLEVKRISKTSKLGRALDAGGFKGRESTPHPQPLSPGAMRKVSAPAPQPACGHLLPSAEKDQAERVAATEAGNDIERLKQALYGVESVNEVVAVAGMRMILGPAVFENDGGKWRNRWRRERARTQEVFAAMVEYMGRAERISSPGGFAEWLWAGATGR